MRDIGLPLSSLKSHKLPSWWRVFMVEFESRMHHSRFASLHLLQSLLPTKVKTHQDSNIQCSTFTPHPLLILVPTTQPLPSAHVHASTDKPLPSTYVLAQTLAAAGVQLACSAMRWFKLVCHVTGSPKQVEQQ